MRSVFAISPRKSKGARRAACHSKDSGVGGSALGTRRRGINLLDVGWTDYESPAARRAEKEQLGEVRATIKEMIRTGAAAMRNSLSTTPRRRAASSCAIWRK